VTRDPPIVEIALGLTFSPLAGPTIIDLSELYGDFADEYPNFQQVQPVPPLQLSPAEVIIPIVTFDLPRVWFISGDAHHLVQFQLDRLMQNWRRVLPLDAPAPEYPGYLEIRRRFAESFGRLRAWAERHGMLHLPLEKAELSYLNAIPLTRSDGTLHRISEVLSFYSPSESTKIVNFQANWWEEVTENLGYVHVLTGVGGTPDGKPVMNVNLSGRCNVQGLSLEEALARVDLLHDKIHEIFARVLMSELTEGMER